MNVSVRELRSQLSRFLKRVGEGEAMTITSHRRPVARLVPMPSEPEDGESPDAFWERLRSLPWVEGQAEPGKPHGLRKGLRLRGPGRTAAEMVVEDRR